MKARARKNPRSELKLEEMRFWVDLALFYEDHLTAVYKELLEEEGVTEKSLNDVDTAVLRQLKLRGRLP